ncbi:Multifunctional non-homologous end joining protein LigD [subsurface metagenome]
MKSELKRRRFVVHKHYAKRLHYDLRLEDSGTLRSWAVPKGVPEEINIKRLAIAVEDHALSYINFEGEIEEGQYGAGRVEIFDEGEYDLIKRTDKKIVFIFKGKKLSGEYSLIKFREPSQWLLSKIVPT